VRFIVFGAGAIGGVVGGRLLEHGGEVGFIARGEHGRAIAANGLLLVSPADSITLRTDLIAERPDDLEWRPDDVVLLAVKSQDTADALVALSRSAPPSVSVVCLQNGVNNERIALRLFDDVYGVTVMCPAGYIEPGTVVAYSSPIAALLDIGRYPTGQDDKAAAIAAAFSAAGMDSIVRSDIMRWKYTKLLMNLFNVVDALCGSEVRGGALAKMLREEAVAVLGAAGIDFAAEDEDRERRGERLRMGVVPGYPRLGSSSRQSLARAVGSIETDYLNGEIVLLGRLHGVPAPVNEHLQELANRAAREKWPPGQLAEEDILKELEARR
jgi:2-dehydropantoate 2-reductase